MKRKLPPTTYECNLVIPSVQRNSKIVDIEFTTSRVKRTKLPPTNPRRQISINDKHPNMRIGIVTVTEITKDNDVASDLVVSCQACNFFQNMLPWSEFLSALLQIAESLPHVLHRDNITPLTHPEKSYIRNHDTHGCPSQLRREVIESYGRHCYYTGVPLQFYASAPFSVSFDRTDSTQPYALNNTRPVGKHINFVKIKNITETDLLGWLAHLRENKSYIEHVYTQSLV